MCFGCQLYAENNQSDVYEYVLLNSLLKEAGQKMKEVMIATERFERNLTPVQRKAFHQSRPERAKHLQK